MSYFMTTKVRKNFEVNIWKKKSRNLPDPPLKDRKSIRVSAAH